MWFIVSIGLQLQFAIVIAHCLVGMKYEPRYPPGAYISVIFLVVSYTIAFYWCEKLCEFQIGVPVIDELDEGLRRNGYTLPHEPQLSETDQNDGEASQPTQFTHLKNKMKLD